METLWQVDTREYDGIKEDFISGCLAPPLAIPVVDCDGCGQPIVVAVGTQPLPCPDAIRKEVQMVYSKSTSSDGRIKMSELQPYLSRWEAICTEHGINQSLYSGASFYPNHWDLSSIPRYHIYAMLFDMVISEHVKTLFQKNSISGVSYPLVVIDRIANYEPTDEPSEEDGYVVPEEGGYFGTWFDRVPCIEDVSQYGSFYSLHVDHGTDYLNCPRQNVTERIACEFCQRKETDVSIDCRKQHRYFRKKRQLPKSYVPNADVFTSHVFSGFIFRDRVKKLLTDEHLQNCQVRPITIVDD